MDAKLVQGWKLVINERSCGNFGDKAGSEHGEGGWRRRSGGKWFAENRQAEIRPAKIPDRN